MDLPQTFAEKTQLVIIMFIPFLIAVIFHEYAHGLMAKRWGDNTAEQAGRLTLNPLPHIDPLGTVILPLIIMFTGTPLLFGWAKPVPISPNRFRKFRAGLFWVSSAGVLMNFTLALISAILYYVFATMGQYNIALAEPLQIMAYSSVSLNFALGIFNLIPLPPLDGSKIIESFLPYEASRKFEAIGQYSFWILMALMFSGAMGILAYPIRFLTGLTLQAVGAIYQMIL